MSSVLKVDQIQSDTGTVNISSNVVFSSGLTSGSAAAPSIFPTGDTNTGIFFPAADTIAFAEGGAEAMRISDAGNVGIGTTSPGARLEVSFSSGNSSNNDEIARFSGNSSAANGTSRYIAVLGTNATFGAKYLDSGGWGAAITGTSMVSFSTGATIGSTTERARINSAGEFIVGKTAETFSTVGTTIYPTGAIYATANQNEALAINRLGNDGNLVRFFQATTEEGTITVSGNTVSYNQFLGSHWAALTDWSKPNIKIGTILDSINELVIWKFAVIEVEEQISAKEAVLDDEGNEIEPAVEAHIGSIEKKICYNGNAEVGTIVSVEYKGETYQGVVELERERELTKAVKVKVNDTAASKAVYGVFVGWNNDTNGDGGVWNDMYVGAVGNYVIRMAAGQEPEIGDLIEADGNGCGVVQDDDIVRTKTVGKITSNIVQKTYEDGSFLVTCVLYSG